MVMCVKGSPSGWRDLKQAGTWECTSKHGSPQSGAAGLCPLTTWHFQVLEMHETVRGQVKPVDSIAYRHLLLWGALTCV